MSDNVQQNGQVSLRPKTLNTIIQQKMSIHPLTNFDEVKFLDLLEHSLSLSVFEKKNIIDQIPNLSQEQIDALMELFETERIDYRKLMPTEGDTIRQWVIAAQNNWEQLKDMYLEEKRALEQSRLDAEKADEIKKSLGL